MDRTGKRAVFPSPAERSEVVDGEGRIASLTVWLQRVELTASLTTITMAELTTEYLDKKLAEQTQALTSYVDAKIVGVEEKIVEQTKDLKAHAESLQAELAGMIERSVNVSQRVERIESDIRAIKQALHM
jgi:maltodextrin utilization protein YvdJ